MEKFKNASKSIASVITLPFKLTAWFVYIGDLQKSIFYYQEH